ncbi:hypothetical protein HKX48_009124, partial [Thoreauomyces humboldtii]
NQYNPGTDVKNLTTTCTCIMVAAYTVMNAHKITKGISSRRVVVGRPRNRATKDATVRTKIGAARTKFGIWEIR